MLVGLHISMEMPKNRKGKLEHLGVNVMCTLVATSVL
jgi:hypothetical protein